MTISNLRLLVICAAALLSSACSSTGLAVINLWAQLGDYKQTTDIAYGEHPLQKLDVYMPKAEQDNAGNPKPVVLFFYGGCWGGCKTYEKAHYQFVADTLTAHGYVAVIADYRRYPKFLIDPILDDGAAVIRWVGNHIANYGGDSRRIFVAGHSAGAHIGLMPLLDGRLTATELDGIAGFIGLAGPYDFLPLTEAYQETLFGPESNYAATQPINFISGKEPPMLLLWGNTDEAVYRHNLVNLAAKVKEMDGHVETHIYEGMSHVGILTQFAALYRGKSAVIDDITAFIEANP